MLKSLKVFVLVPIEPPYLKYVFVLPVVAYKKISTPKNHLHITRLLTRSMRLLKSFRVMVGYYLKETPIFFFNFESPLNSRFLRSLRPVPISSEGETINPRYSYSVLESSLSSLTLK